MGHEGRESARPALSDDRAIFRRYGYNPDDPVPRDEEGHRIIPTRLLEALAAAPLIPEERIAAFKTMKDARRLASRRGLL